MKRVLSLLLLAFLAFECSPTEELALQPAGTNLTPEVKQYVASATKRLMIAFNAQMRKPVKQPISETGLKSFLSDYRSLTTNKKELEFIDALEAQPEIMELVAKTGRLLADFGRRGSTGRTKDTYWTEEDVLTSQALRNWIDYLQWKLEYATLNSNASYAMELTYALLGEVQEYAGEVIEDNTLTTDEKDYILVAVEMTMQAIPAWSTSNLA